MASGDAKEHGVERLAEELRLLRRRGIKQRPTKEHECLDGMAQR